MYSWCVNHVSVIIQYKVSFGLSVQVQCVGEGFQLAAIVEQCVVTSGKEVPRGWHSCSHHAGILQLAFPPVHFIAHLRRGRVKVDSMEFLF